MSEDNFIEWSVKNPLSWSDFQAEANLGAYEDSHSFIKYHYTWTVTSDNVGPKIVFLIENIQLFTQFHCLLSWIRPNQENNSLLNHEQGHFDLSELIKRQHIDELQNKFNGKYYPTRGKNEEQRKQFAKEDSGKMIAKEIEKLEKILSEKRRDYDEETEFGANHKMQSEYDSVFSKLKN